MQVTSLPVHFHTHDTSGGSIASTIAMARAGCHVIDFATAALANCTSQPSLNAFLAGACDWPGGRLTFGISRPLENGNVVTPC